MDYEGFKLFMSAYLGNNVSEELCKDLFWAFHKSVPVPGLQSSSLSAEVSQAIIDNMVGSASQQDLARVEQRRGECG